jgi:hypothetical protein
MKKITLVSFALTPIVLFAQAPAPSSSFDGFGSVLMALLICVIIFIVCRELLCWYYKINKMVSNQEEMIRLLKKLAGEENDDSKILNQFKKDYTQEEIIRLLKKIAGEKSNSNN